MVVNYGFLNYDEPKKSVLETPKKLYEFNLPEDTTDTRAEATALAEEVYDNLKGKEKFRFYIKGENGVSSVYQVNFVSEPRDFFESELADDLSTLLLTKK